jgi:hypothetical protein
VIFAAIKNVTNWTILSHLFFYAARPDLAAYLPEFTIMNSGLVVLKTRNDVVVNALLQGEKDLVSGGASEIVSEFIFYHHDY